MLKTKERGQAGMDLLAAIDDDTYAVLDGRAEEKAAARNRRLSRYAQEFRDMLSPSHEGGQEQNGKCLEKSRSHS